MSLMNILLLTFLLATKITLTPFNTGMTDIIASLTLHNLPLMLSLSLQCLMSANDYLVALSCLLLIAAPALKWTLLRPMSVLWPGMESRRKGHSMIRLLVLRKANNGMNVVRRVRRKLVKMLHHLYL